MSTSWYFRSQYSPLNIQSVRFVCGFVPNANHLKDNNTKQISNKSLALFLHQSIYTLVSNLLFWILMPFVSLVVFLLGESSRKLPHLCHPVQVFEHPVEIVNQLGIADLVALCQAFHSMTLQTVWTDNTGNEGKNTHERTIIINKGNSWNNY